MADSRKALAGAAFFAIAVIVAAAFQAPDAPIVAGFGGPIISLAQVSMAGSPRLSHAFLVYLGEISYSIYTVCMPSEAPCVNVAVKIGQFSAKQLPPLLLLVFLVTLDPLATATHHLIETPAPRRMKLWRRSRTGHNFATATAR